MKYGIFGGSFDPPHMSHALAVLWALETDEVDRVLVIPCGEHALGKTLYATFDDRMEMCRRAFSRLDDGVEILDIERRRDEVSYTIDTLHTLREQRPGNQWRLLIGSDILHQTDRWKSWDEIERLAPPLVIPRLTGQVEEDMQSEDDLRTLSSTQLRDHLTRGRIPKGLIPASVLAYIREKRLYLKKE